MRLREQRHARGRVRRLFGLAPGRGGRRARRRGVREPRLRPRRALVRARPHRRRSTARRGASARGSRPARRERPHRRSPPRRRAAGSASSRCSARSLRTSGPRPWATTSTSPWVHSTPARILFRSGSGAVTPASTTKLLTATAALEELGPMARFRTTVRQSGKRIVLVGGGDPFLATSPKAAKGLYPQRATLTDSRRRRRRPCRPAASGPVRLGYDDSLFSGPAIEPAVADVVPARGRGASDHGPVDRRGPRRRPSLRRRPVTRGRRGVRLRPGRGRHQGPRRARAGGRGRLRRPRSRRSRVPRSVRSSSAPLRSPTTTPPRCSRTTSGSRSGRTGRSPAARRR